MRTRLLLVLALLWPLGSEAGCPRPLRVPFEDWRPYSYFDESGRHTGLETELLAAVAKEAGCEVRYLQGIPRNRRLGLLMSGELDLLLAASYDGPTADGLAWYTQSYRDEEFAAFMLAGSTAPVVAQTLNDLLVARLRLLTHRGPNVAPDIASFEHQQLLTYFEDYAKGVQLLARQRGDVLVGDRLAIAYAAEVAGVTLIELPTYVRRDVVAYKLSRKTFSAEQLNEFNQAIQRLEARGELQRIRSRWLPAALRGR